MQRDRGQVAASLRTCIPVEFAKTEGREARRHPDNKRAGRAQPTTCGTTRRSRARAASRWSRPTGVWLRWSSKTSRGTPASPVCSRDECPGATSISSPELGSVNELRTLGHTIWSSDRAVSAIASLTSVAGHGMRPCERKRFGQ